MTRTELINLVIMDACADDYEDRYQIYKLFDQVAPQMDNPPTHAEINAQILELVADGLMAGYFLFTGVYEAPLDQLRDGLNTPYLGENGQDPYFYQTPKGKAVHAADDYWPFDEPFD